MLRCRQPYCGGQLLPALPPSGGAWPVPGTQALLECSLCAREYEWDRLTRQPAPLLPPALTALAISESPAERAVAAAIVTHYHAQRAAQQPELPVASLL